MKKPPSCFFFLSYSFSLPSFLISFSLWTENRFYKSRIPFLWMNGVGYLHILRKPVSTYSYVCSLLKEGHRHQSGSKVTYLHICTRAGLGYGTP